MTFERLILGACLQGEIQRDPQYLCHSLISSTVSPQNIRDLLRQSACLPAQPPHCHPLLFPALLQLSWSWGFRGQRVVRKISRCGVSSWTEEGLLAFSVCIRSPD